VKEKILVIGLGHMGASLAKGLLQSSWTTYLFDIHEDRRKFFSGTNAKIISDLKDVPKDLDAMLVCVKPHDMVSLAQMVRENTSSRDYLLCSILAGTEISAIAEIFDHRGPVVRAMPNIAATIGLAATALCASDGLEEKSLHLAEKIFRSAGEVCWVKESLMDTVTGLSGSGPAYIYMVIEALIDGGVKMGLPRQLASSLAVQTVLGAASLVKQSGQHPAVLKDQVTTPAGTTISALHVLEERGLRSMFVAAVEEATERSKEIGRQKKANQLKEKY
jgi:pyrroline-5-carboxylate reductase